MSRPILATLALLLAAPGLAQGDLPSERSAHAEEQRVSAVMNETV